MQHLRLCMFIASIAVLKAYETLKLCDYVSYVSGDYDNKEQTQKAGDRHDFVQARVIPVYIPCFWPTMTAHALPFVTDIYRGICSKPTSHKGLYISFSCLKKLHINLYPDPVLFVETAVNEVITNLAVVLVTDDFEDTVSLTIYNFTDYTKYKPGEFNVKKLSTISCEDLQRDEDCTGSFRVSRKGVVGNFPLCNLTENGKHPRMTIVHRCDSANVKMPMGSPVKPYKFRKRQKYPSIDPPADYVGPCDK